MYRLPVVVEFFHSQSCGLDKCKLLWLGCGVVMFVIDRSPGDCFC